MIHLAAITRLAHNPMITVTSQNLLSQNLLVWHYEAAWLLAW